MRPARPETLNTILGGFVTSRTGRQVGNWRVSKAYLSTWPTSTNSVWFFAIVSHHSLTLTYLAYLLSKTTWLIRDPDQDLTRCGEKAAHPPWEI